jgi:hypothetical protein
MVLPRIILVARSHAWTAIYFVLRFLPSRVSKRPWSCRFKPLIGSQPEGSKVVILRQSVGSPIVTIPRAPGLYVTDYRLDAKEFTITRAF